MKNALFVIANNGFQDTEYETPKKILEDNGVIVITAAKNKGECYGTFGAKTYASLSLSEVNSDKFDIIVFIGGQGAYKEYFKNQEYLNLAKSAKKVAAICIAPMIISDSGIFERKRVTSWNDLNKTQKKYIETNKGVYTGTDVEVDLNIITANGPNAAKKFGEKILGIL